jgi:hypothetical protein
MQTGQRRALRGDIRSKLIRSIARRARAPDETLLEYMYNHNPRCGSARVFLPCLVLASDSTALAGPSRCGASAAVMEHDRAERRFSTIARLRHRPCRPYALARGFIPIPEARAFSRGTRVRHPSARVATLDPSRLGRKSLWSNVARRRGRHHARVPAPATPERRSTNGLRPLGSMFERERPLCLVVVSEVQGAEPLRRCGTSARAEPLMGVVAVASVAMERNMKAPSRHRRARRQRLPLTREASRQQAAAARAANMLQVSRCRCTCSPLSVLPLRHTARHPENDAPISDCALTARSNRVGDAR